MSSCSAFAQTLSLYQDKGEVLPILDVRPTKDFIAGHVKGSCNIPWVAEEGVKPLSERVFELPPSQVECLALVSAGGPDLMQTLQYLRERRYNIPEHCILVYNADEVESIGWVERGHSCTRLWSPAPFVEWNIARVEQEVCQGVVHREGGADANGEPYRAIDIGSGSGRDSVFLAIRGWHVLAVDNLQRLLDNTVALAETHGCAKRVQTLCIDLRHPAPLLEYPPFHLVLVSRFLHRPLLPILRELLAPGGAIMYQQFLQGAEKIGKCTPKNPNRLLAPQELAGVYGAKRGFRILFDDTTTTEDGRPMNSFVSVRERGETREGVGSQTGT